MDEPQGGDMYRAFSSGFLGFPGRSVKDDIPLAVKYGYKGIVFDIKKESTACSPGEFTELLAKNDLKPAAFAFPVEFRKSREIFDADIKALRPYCEFAEKTGSLCCNTWLLPFSDTLDYKSNFAQHRERLSLAAKILEEYGVRLGLEFVGPPKVRKGKTFEFIHDLDGTLELIAAIGSSNLGHLLDVFHWDLAGQTFDDFRKIPDGGQVIFAHINDARPGLAREEQEDQKRELPGATGVLRIDEFMKGLQSLKYRGPVAVEPFYAPLKAMPLEEAVKAAKAATDKVWPK